MAQEVEHILGKDEVTSSSLVSSSTKKHTRFGCVFLMCAKFFAHICTISSKLCVEPVVCARCLFLQAIPHLRLPSAALWFILSQEPVVCARRSRILRALIAFSCRQQLIKYRLFTTKTSCFFNAFLTHLRDLFPNRAWSLSSALDAFSCKQSLIFACRQQLYGLFCHRSLSSALGDREYFVLSSPSLAVSSSLNIVCSRRKRRVFLMRF